MIVTGTAKSNIGADRLRRVGYGQLCPSKHAYQKGFRGLSGIEIKLYMCNTPTKPLILPVRDVSVAIGLKMQQLHIRPIINAVIPPDFSCLLSIFGQTFPSEE